MNAQLLEGKILAANIQEQIKSILQGFEPPQLIAIQVSDDPSAEWYINQQERLTQKLGVRFKRVRPGEIKTQAELVKTMQDANARYDGIFLAMPLPPPFNSDDALRAMDFMKDVEGIHPINLGNMVLRKTKLIPPTAFAALALIESTGIPIRGKKAVIIGQSAIVGRPLQLLLGERRATTIVCNTGTLVSDIQKYVSDADIIVACAGQPNLVKGDWIKSGAVVIDIGTTETNGTLVGDVEFESASKRAGFITPVPGGVGPLTVTMLMQNLANAYRAQKEVRAVNR